MKDNPNPKPNPNPNTMNKTNQTEETIKHVNHCECCGAEMQSSLPHCATCHRELWTFDNHYAPHNGFGNSTNLFD